MDALDRLAPPAVDLLTRVDDILARAGAPPEHPVWPLLRRVRALPGEAVTAFAAVSPAALAAAGADLRGLCTGYERAGAAAPAATGWRGAGAESFGAQWSALRRHLAEDLTGRLRATVSYVDAVGEWTRDTRGALARTLAVILTCAEAVVVRTAGAEAEPESPSLPGGGDGGGDVARAAADIAVRVLSTLAEAYDRGETLLDEWAPRLDEVVYQAPATAASAGVEVVTEVPY